MLATSIKRAVTVIGAGAMLALFATATPAQAAVPLGGTVQIKNKATGNCLDVIGGLTHNGTWAGHYPCSGADNQKWRIEYVGTDTFQECGGWGSIIDPVTGIPRGVCNIPTNISVPYFRIKSVVGDNCLDLSNRSVASGTRVHLWDCYDTNSQHWYIAQDSSGGVEFESRRSHQNWYNSRFGNGRSIEPRWDDPNKIQIWTSNTETQLQRWTVTSV
ncbi:RICIN domain-containing protein [Nonomuraea jiangxiensis]|uniref:Ricin-type beta-trefoil lectin domain-like n=1 Tax=Nonomuraea jiangxiensis TaxID=633440 RepID=A0A1G9IXZ6_9ACTN|nr:RICIN domain-containing protein [Nonomuraea jiangxiensis]SDL30129.1 Ricin-type beta-trefoil lectin domain-like [Nonomuraea jiangxiensis]